MKHRKTILMPARSVLAESKKHPVAANEARLRGTLDHWDYNKLTITRKPAVREVYWIAAPPGSRTPEFTGYHPGVILRPPVSMSADQGTVVFVPLSSVAPRGFESGKPLPPYLRELSENPGPEKARPVWAICDMVMTASICRLEMYLERGKGQWVPRISQADFEQVLEGLASAIVPLRKVIEERMGKEHAEIMTRTTRAHDLRIASIEEEILERLTSPGK